MTQDPNPKQQKRGKLKITQEDVVRDYFCTMKGWAETADEVYALFADKRKEEKQELREEKLETQRAGAANIIVMNKNDSTGIGKVDQVNGVIEEGAEVTHTKHN